MNQASGPGEFVWHDLMTRDPEAAIPFYCELFGWTVAEVDRGPKVGACKIFRRDDRDICSIIAMKKDEPMPSHWISYISAEDVDDTATKAKDIGGLLHVPPLDVPGLGKFCVVADPKGAVFSPFRFENGCAPEAAANPAANGEFCWHELLSQGADEVGAFYSQLFGWEQRTVSMGEMGLYHLFDRNGVEIAGMMQMPAESAGATSNWLPYLAVDDVDTATDKIKQLGGGIFVGPMDIPDVGRICVAADPTGAMFATFRKLDD